MSKNSPIENSEALQRFSIFLLQAVYFSAYLSIERMILKGFTPGGSRSMVGDILRHEYCIQHSLTVTQRCLVKVFVCNAAELIQSLARITNG